MTAKPARLARLALPLLLAAGLPLGAADQKKALFTITDPRGDDHGDGTLRYPRRDDIKPGDLDLLSLSARADDEGTWFEATFARPIRRTEPRPIDDGGTPMTDVARFGFYTFNLDIYVDTDRKPGSGNTRSLPGRKVEIDPAYAWEKAICLTPRPYDAKDQLRKIFEKKEKADALIASGGLKGSLEGDQKKEIRTEVTRAVDEQVFFPTKITIAGSTIRFFVPASFLGGAARADWAYAVAVSVCWVNQGFDLAVAVGARAAQEPGLYIMPVGSGLPADRLGTQNDDPLLPPLLDIVVPKGMSQEKVLADDNPVQQRLVRLPAVVPADLK